MCNAEGVQHLHAAGVRPNPDVTATASRGFLQRNPSLPGGQRHPDPMPANPIHTGINRPVTSQTHSQTTAGYLR